MSNGRGKITCHYCGAKWYRRELKIMADTDADEYGVYVVYEYVCPACSEPIYDRRLKPLRGYVAPSFDEPLRWED